jgi:hypothetical protein
MLKDTIKRCRWRHPDLFAFKMLPNGRAVVTLAGCPQEAASAAAAPTIPEPAATAPSPCHGATVNGQEYLPAAANAATVPRKARGFANIRIQETERLIIGRLSIAGVLELPDTVDSRKIISFELEHIANTSGNVRRKMRDCCHQWASSWLDDDSVEDMIERALDEASYRPEKWTARAAGNELGVTDAERSSLGLTTFRAIDLDDAEYNRRHKEANAERQRRYRDNRKMKRPKKPTTKPWELLDPPLTRATYYRRGLHRKG